MPAKELQELEQWKVGDRVVVNNGSSLRQEYISTITRITDGRGGTIYVNCDAYDMRGHQRTSDTWHSKMITPATMDDLKRIQGEASKSWLVNYKWNNLTGEQAMQVEGFLRGMGINIREKKS